LTISVSVPVFLHRAEVAYGKSVVVVLVGKSRDLVDKNLARYFKCYFTSKFNVLWTCFTYQCGVTEKQSFLSGNRQTCKSRRLLEQCLHQFVRRRNYRPHLCGPHQRLRTCHQLETSPGIDRDHPERV